MIFDGIELTHEQQQCAVEKIQQLMKAGIESRHAIAIVAQKIREELKGENLKPRKQDVK